MLQVLGVGMPRTGTRSMVEAMSILGYRALHFSPDRLPPYTLNQSSFRVFDDVDAVFDLPASFFYDELLQTYPDIKLILTTRDTSTWWLSMQRHACNCGYELPANQDMARKLHGMMLGWPDPHEFIWKRSFERWNHTIMTNTSLSARLLVMDVSIAQPWVPLCGFLARPVPEQPFPWLHRSTPAIADVQSPNPDCKPDAG